MTWDLSVQWMIHRRWEVRLEPSPAQVQPHKMFNCPERNDFFINKVLCWGKVCSVGSSSRLGGWRRRSPGQGDGRHQACHKRGSCEGPGNLPDGETCAPRPRCQGCCPAATSHFEVGGAPSPRSTSFPIGSPEKTEGRSRIHRMISCLFLQRLFVLSSMIDLILKE